MLSIPSATKTRGRKMEAASILYLLIAGITFSSFLSVGNAEVPCTSDEMCQISYNTSDSFCLPDKQTCSNPFRNGCLKAMNISRYRDGMRICNSNDDLTNVTELSSDDSRDASNSAGCKVSEFPYLEIRIHQGDWESSYFLAWIYQIVLMELVGVPATVGLTGEMTKLSDFYAMENQLQFSPLTYSPEGLIRSNQANGCNQVEEECVHVLPEVWDGQREIYEKLFAEDEIYLPSSNGMLGQTSLYVPSFTARNNPALTSFLGYEGETNRPLLAELFKRPSTWQEYCELVSKNNCTIPNIVTSEYPSSEEEKGQYFAQGRYTGHFEATRESDCTQVQNCAGYIVGPPCELTTNLDAQLHWNNITGLRRDGPLLPDGAYTTKSMREIWLAANATRSNVIMWWFSTNEIQQLFDYTESSFQEVLLPKPTALCLDHRTTIGERCDADASVRRGDERGACDDEPQALQRLIAVSLANSNNGLDEADRSPGFEVILNLKMNSFDMSQIIGQWVAKGNDRDGNDAREAVCEWVVENLETLESYIPPGFPREVLERTSTEWYTIFAQVVAVLTALATIVAIILVSKYARTKIMVFAQPLFLFLVLSGFLLISIAAFMMVMQPTTFLCIFVEWLVVLGYSIALVPVLVKTAAINRLMNSSKKMQRIRLNSKMLFVRVVGAVCLVLVGLILWTYQDPPTAFFRQEVSLDDSRVVIRDLECESDSVVWTAVQLSWETVLLLMAAVLAFQSRKAASIINDSKSLGIMIYSHVVFVGIRGILVFLDETNALEGSIIVAMFSFNYSLDALLALLVYVYPKIYLARKEPEDYLNEVRGGSTRFTTQTRKMSAPRSSSRESSRLASIAEKPESTGSRDKSELKILLCTGNLGNAEPTTESLMAWIPPDGCCDQVTPLDGVTSLGEGNFDLIVIGMQESTWKTTSDVLEDTKNNETDISEADILRAMEAHDTATLRQKVRDILGESYFQVAEESRGQMRLHVWAAECVIDDIDDITITGANTGVGNVLANKGGIVLTLECKKTQLSFLSAHLAAHEGQSYYKNRCKNVRSILREGKTSTLSSKLDISMSSDHVFVMGDLNFRTNFGMDEDHEENVQRALDMIDAKDFSTLYSYDELQKGIEAGDLLVDFKTLPCLFPPTFKVEREPGFVYKRQRTPSYTDRILYKSLPSLEPQLKALAYEPCHGFTTSDHKPLRGAFSIVPNASFNSLSVQNETTLVFRNFSCVDLPPADSNGLADPYVMIMWEKDSLEEVRINLGAKLRRFFLGKARWPRTPYRPKTLYPEWKDEEIVLRTQNGDVPPGTKLFLVLVDYDTLSKDDYMCTTCLDLAELMEMGPNQREKVVPFYRHLQRHGRNTGRIKFYVDVKRENMQRRKSFFYRPSHFPVEASQYDLSDSSFKSINSETTI